MYYFYAKYGKINIHELFNNIIHETYDFKCIINKNKLIFIDDKNNVLEDKIIDEVIIDYKIIDLSDMKINMIYPNFFNKYINEYTFVCIDNEVDDFLDFKISYLYGKNYNRNKFIEIEEELINLKYNTFISYLKNNFVKN